MEDFVYFLTTSKQRKRKAAFFHESVMEEVNYVYEDDNHSDELENIAHLAGVLMNKPRKARGGNLDRELRKQQWEELYRQKTDPEFKEKMRISRTTFDYLLGILWDDLLNMCLKHSNLIYSSNFSVSAFILMKF